MPVPEHFLLDRDRFARALQDARAIAEIRAGRRRPLNAAVAAFFESAVDAGAIAGPRGVRSAVYAVGAEDLIVAVGDADRHDVCQAATVPFNVNQILSVPARGFTAACDVVDRALRRADALVEPLQAMRSRARLRTAPHLAMLISAAGRAGQELAIPFPGGRMLCTNAGLDPEPWVGADYLRVCEPDGTEIAVWERIEWEEDPVVIAAVLSSALSSPNVGDAPSIARDRLHALLVRSDEYGEELAIPCPGGRTLRTDAGKVGERWIGAHYLRVCEPDGAEVAYWDNAEWGEEPIEVIGAVIGCALGAGDVEEMPS